MPSKIETRAFEPQTLEEFKGLNVSDGVYFNYGGKKAEAAILTNFNTTPDGYLQKRRGFNLFCTFPVGNPGYMRFCGVIRDISTRTIWLYWTDGASLWRCNQDGGTPQEVRMMTSNNYIGGMAGVLQNGTPPNTTYDGTGYGSAGIIGIYGATPTAINGWVSGSPASEHAVTFKNRMWTINGGTTGGLECRLNFSGVTNYADWTTGGSSGGGNLYIDYHDGDYLSGMIPYNDNLIIFKSRKTYSLTADGDPTGWSYRLISDRAGCLAARSIQVINGFMYFLSIDGVYKSDGTTYEIISDSVNEYLQGYRASIKPIDFHNVFAHYWDNKYILFIPKDISTPNDQAVVYDLLTEQWSYWDFSASGVALLSGYRVSDTTTDKLVLGNHVTGAHNRIWVMDTQYQDNGLNYTATWQGRRQDFGDAVNKKRNHIVSAVISADPTAAGGTLGTEQSVRGVPGFSNTSEGLGSAVVFGVKYRFLAPGSITGVELYCPSPAVAGGLTYQASVWNLDGSVLYVQKNGTLTGGQGWHTLYFDTPFVITPNIDYVVSMGTPAGVTGNNKGWANVNHTAVASGSIQCVPDNINYQLGNVSTGFPSQIVVSANTLSQLGPIFAEPLPATVDNVTIETISDDTTVVTSTQPTAKLSDRLIKAKGAGYGRYFQTKVSYNGRGPFSLYGVQWMNETRGIQPNSGPNRNV